VQLLNPELAAQRAVSLPEMLSCRELRQSRQQRWLTDYRTPLISLTLVSPGPVKDSPLTRRIFNLALQALESCFNEHKWQPVAAESYALPTGSEAIIALNIPAEVIKAAMVRLEQAAPIGRLWDIDVIDTTGRILSRSDNGLSARTCLVCDNDARVCGRNRTHSFEELTQAMEKLLDNSLHSDPQQNAAK
jgi:holo-ACP synthase